MKLLRSLCFAFSMFSRLPVPTLSWRDDNMRYIMAMFPFVGAAAGLITWLWLLLCRALDFSVFLRAAGLAILPVAVTGGIHLDGFCDTIDALASGAPPERKRAILKDPNAGAFAVVAAGCFLLAYFALSAELEITAKTPLLLLFTFTLSRSLSGFSVLTLKESAAPGLAGAFKQSADRRLSLVVLGAFFLISAAGLIWFGGITGVVMVAAALLCFLRLRRLAVKTFEAMSGDLAGYFLEICELSMLAAQIFVPKVVTAWF
jgi:adenosylcobinamide-GDP ribazoletransferase